MATHQSPGQPRLLRGERKFGRYGGFKEFSHLPSGSASIGSKTVSTITIDCQFMFKQSIWGVMGDAELPAGILYLNFSFGPPQGSRLKSATITITLDDQDASLEPYQKARQRPGRDETSDYPVQITDWYGPKQLVGEERNVDKRRTKKMVPELNVMGNGGGGLGAESETSFQQSARWSFSGQLLAGKKPNPSTYKTLQWHLTENEMEIHPAHSNQVYTAFAFHHSGRPFLMKVDIEGRLHRLDKMKQASSKMKFGGTARRDNRAVTLIDLPNFDHFTRPLDEDAMKLPEDMRKKNLKEIPLVVPNPVLGTGHEEAESISTVTPVVVQPPQQKPHVIFQQQGGFHQNIPHQHALPIQASDPIAPTIENLARVLQNLSAPVPQDMIFAKPAPSASNTLLSSSADTCVDSALVDDDEDDVTGSSDHLRDAKQQPQQQEQRRLSKVDTGTRPFNNDLARAYSMKPAPDPAAAVIQLLQIPGIVGVLRIVAVIFRVFGYWPAGDVENLSESPKQSSHERRRSTTSHHRHQVDQWREENLLGQGTATRGKGGRVPALVVEDAGREPSLVVRAEREKNIW